MELVRFTTDEITLTDEQFAMVAQFADAPAPAIVPVTEGEFGKLMSQLTATLSMRGSDEGEGMFKLAVYRRMLGHLPLEVMQRVVRQALAECDWMPTPAAMLRMAEAHTAPSAAAHAKARYLTRERRHREQREQLELMKSGELDLAAAPERLLQVGVAQGHVFRKRDGSYAYRTAENLAADEPNRDSDGSPKGEDPEGLRAQHDSAGLQGIAENLGKSAA